MKIYRTTWFRLFLSQSSSVCRASPLAIQFWLNSTIPLNRILTRGSRRSARWVDLAEIFSAEPRAEHFRATGGAWVTNKPKHTIAGVRNAVGWRCACSAICSAICPTIALLLAMSTEIGRSAQGAQPGDRSRRVTSDDGHSGEKPASRGFGFRSIFDGIKNDQKSLLDELPMQRLTPAARRKLSAITDKPTLYRQLPTQLIQCDQELFLFLTRKPEAIIGIWDLMGITQVQATRVSPYTMNAVDGCGTSCEIDLIYGDTNLHVFMADGKYDGKFVQKPILGKGVFVMKSTYVQSPDGGTTVQGSLDCYVKFDSLGADIVARSLGGLIGKSADHNFTETAKFLTQISKACETNPVGMLDMADRIDDLDPATKAEFKQVITNVAKRGRDQSIRAAKLLQARGLKSTPR